MIIITTGNRMHNLCLVYQYMFVYYDNNIDNEHNYHHHLSITPHDISNNISCPLFINNIDNDHNNHHQPPSTSTTNSNNNNNLEESSDWVEMPLSHPHNPHHPTQRNKGQGSSQNHAQPHPRNRLSLSPDRDRDSARDKERDRLSGGSRWVVGDLS